MSRKREAVFMGAGVLAGLALCGPASAAVQQLTATPTTQSFYVDGQRVSMTAYSIGGNNYVRLRDIGREVDFGVTYDTTTNSVHIDSTCPYREEAITAPSDPTEESVRMTLAKLKEQYPSQSTYPSPYISSSGGPYGVSNTNCAGWAVLCSDAVFGNLPWRRIDRPSWNQLRPGDLVEYDDTISRHVVVVVSKKAGYIMVTESGTDQQVLWSGQYFRWWLEQQPHYISYTRYPQ